MTFLDVLDRKNIKYVCELDTSKVSSIKAGGFAKIAAYPKSYNEFINIIKAAKAFEIKNKIETFLQKGFWFDYFSKNSEKFQFIFVKEKKNRKQKIIFVFWIVLKEKEKSKKNLKELIIRIIFQIEKTHW